MNIRARADKLAVWLADSSEPEAVIRIGKMVKERLGLPEAHTIIFNVHKEEKNRPGGNKNKIVV